MHLHLPERSPLDGEEGGWRCGTAGWQRHGKGSWLSVMELCFSGRADGDWAG